MNIYNGFLETIILPAGDLLTGGTFIKEIRRWRRYDKLSESELESMTRNNLDDMLEYAVREIPFYRDLRLEGDDPYEKLRSFPVMYKKDINENIDRLTSKPVEKLLPFSGSGSSGFQTTVYVTGKELSTTRAIQTHWWEWSGYRIGKKLLQTGITLNRGLVKKVKDILLRTKYVSAFNLGDKDVIKILDGVSGQKGYYFGGYASSLGMFASSALRNGISDIRFEAAISWGDKLFDKYREDISEAFGCTTYDTYGCSEGIMIAAKKDLDYYYMMTPHVHVEIVDENGREVPDGEMGFVLLTRLDNRSMPLIRYYIGDIAIKLPRQKYPEKREMAYPLLEMIIGRDTDVVVTPSGKKMIVHFFTAIFGHKPGITQFRVIQRVKEEIEIEYIPSDSFSESCLPEIENEIRERLGEEYPIKWIKTDHIPPTASGKPQIIQSLLK